MSKDTVIESQKREDGVRDDLTDLVLHLPNSTYQARNEPSI